MSPKTEATTSTRKKWICKREEEKRKCQKFPKKKNSIFQGFDGNLSNYKKKTKKDKNPTSPWKANNEFYSTNLYPERKAQNQILIETLSVRRK